MAAPKPPSGCVIMRLPRTVVPLGQTLNSRQDSEVLRRLKPCGTKMVVLTSAAWVQADKQIFDLDPAYRLSSPGGRIGLTRPEAGHLYPALALGMAALSSPAASSRHASGLNLHPGQHEWMRLW